MVLYDANMLKFESWNSLVLFPFVVGLWFLELWVVKYDFSNTSLGV